MPDAADENIVALTAEIVSAYLSNNRVTGDDLPVLIQKVYASLKATSAPPAPPEEPAEPAVPVKRSVFPDEIVCLQCGRRMTSLKRHLAADHALTPAEYRTRWGLPDTYPMVAPNYAQRRSEMAKQIGLGRKPESAPPIVEGVVVQKIPQQKRGRPRKSA